MPSAESLRVTVTLGADDIARLVAEDIRALPLLARARVLNTLLHREPAVFAALLTRRGKEPYGVPEVDAQIFSTNPPTILTS